MKPRTLGERAVAAVTLFSFTLTTISPSLAWAAEREEAAPAAAAGQFAPAAVPARTRVADEAASEELAAGHTRADVAVDASQTRAGSVSSVVAPPKDELKNAAGGVADKAPALDAQVQAADATTVALPTGGDKSGVTSQAISVPKGSGTIQGMGESFSAQLSTGIATFSVPFALPAARGGAQPSLGLSYSSASGAGLAGMGWSVGVPYIARQTDRGLPGYDDRSEWHANQDRFVFNGGQELVPICVVGEGLACAGALAGEVMPPWGAGYQYFRPRVEGSFLRFFWSADHRTWRVQDKSGVTMELGVPLDGSGYTNALEVNPDAKSQIFRWHLVRQYDTYGSDLGTTSPKPVNVVVYKYSQDGGQALLSDIYDTTPASTPNTTDVTTFAHHTRLNYEDRTDPTETYHSGWLIRSNKRLAGVDVTSKTDSGVSEARRQVRRYHLQYDGRFHTSYLTSVEVEGRCGGSEHDESVPAESDELLGATNCPKLPPMTFDYGHVKGFNTSGGAIESGLAGYEAFDARIQQIGGDPPHSVDEELTDYFDVNADGLPDVLVTAPGVYGNDYGVFFNSAGGGRNTFGAVEQLGVVGVLGANSGSIKLSNQNVSALDFDGDGSADFLHMPKVKTYSAYRFTPPSAAGGKWRLVGRAIDVANQQSPKVDLGKDAAETRVADVNFDGMVDLVVSTGTQFQTFLSLGRLPGGDAQFGRGSWASNATSTLSNDPIAMCVPYSGTPVRFSDSDIQLADMNGDGIQDIVRLRRGDVRYWPGRGNGFWGTGKLDDCPAGTFGDKRYVTTESAPYYSDIEGTSLRMDDVNGDGLDDLVQVRFDAVDVWLNVDGRGWTQRYIIDGTVPSPSFANRVRLMDINGSGTRDIVWGNGKKYEYLDLAGGERPGLLVGVKNGLGKSTAIEYSSSTQEMLAAERTGAECNGTEGTFDHKWCSKMPTVTQLVKRVTESDNLSVAGSGKSQYVTEYGYRDPVYEGRQREFRGFRKARSKRIGDANSPTDFTESTFLLGECEDEMPDNGVDDCSLPERWRDNPKEALKGLPVVTERFDEEGLRLSTGLTTYRLRHLYTGLDGRVVRHAFQSSTSSYQYDTAAGPASQQLGTFTAVELERTYDAAFDPQARPVLAPAGVQAVDNQVVGFAHYSGAGTAIVESAAVVDYFGNQVTAVAKGCTGGGACPSADEVIYHYTLPSRIGDWLFRTERSYTVGSIHTAVRGDSTTSYDAFGAPSSATALLSGAVPIDRFHSYGTRQFASAPATASVDGVITLWERSYDAFGNVIQEKGPQQIVGSSTVSTNRCRTISYDLLAAEESVLGYRQLPTTETTFIDGCDSARRLMTVAGYDRGLGLATTVTDMSLQTSYVKYDGFGRMVEMRRPRPDGSEQPADALPSVKIDYDLPSDANQRPYSIIHTQTQDGATVDTNAYLEAYSYVDGMGRSRVSLAEADQAEDGADWIVSGIGEFDAKGAARRKYLPFFLNGAASDLALVAVPSSPYGRQRYDAFGRQIQTFDVDGTVTLQSRYHALSTDLYDAADLQPGPHQGSYASTRTDGHGRTVSTTERLHRDGALEANEVRTTYLPTGEPEVLSRIHNGDTGTAVVRWMAYDSLGRMVVNVDPHTSQNFAPLPTWNAIPSTNLTPSPTGLKAWRYAYDVAGDLVATSDARGCGQNFFYDGAGRLVAEDYSPCDVAHDLYSAPDWATMDGVEVLYQYDDGIPANFPANVTAPTDFDRSSLFLRGKLVAVHDRAASSWLKYDARGRVVQSARRIASSTTPADAIGSRYSPRFYYKDVTFDAADRPVSESTGATQLLGVDGQSVVTTEYTQRGTVKQVGSSYGALVTKIGRDAEGKVVDLSFGDKAGTKTHNAYDSRRRLASVQTYRGPPPVWSSTPAAYSPAPAPGAEPPTTLQLLLEDLDYKYDVVNNPIEIRDWRVPEEWPDGSKPVSRRFEYDDLYRVTRTDYEYAGGSDTWTSPFAADLADSSDPRRPQAVARKVFATRPLWQTFQYDWLGNTAKTDDDAHAYYDRSLGVIVNDSATSRPYRIKSSVQGTSGSPYYGYTDSVTYDAAGNLTALRFAQSATNCGIAGGSPNRCWHRAAYKWDEVGRLSQAIRSDGQTGPNLTFQYAYDYSDDRVIREDGTVAPHVRTTLYIFDSLELRGAPLDTSVSPNEYPLTAQNEVPYLFANGLRLGRIVKEPDSVNARFKGEPQLSLGSGLAPSLHLFLELPDHLGSTSLVVDYATSELVEARTYQPYGATESDYRPERWKGFREDYGFTGKEEDVEVGLIYFGKRYLSPYLGRWMSADPLAVHSPGEADLNLYAYVKGMVLKAIDPLGLDVYAEQGEGPAQQTGNVTTLPTVTIFATDTPTFSDLQSTGRLDAQDPDSGDLFDSDGQLNFERPEIKPAPAYPPSNMASSRPNAFEKGVANAVVQLFTEPVLVFFRGSPEGPGPIRPFADGDDVLGGLFVNGLTLGVGFASSGPRAALQAPKLVLNPRLSASSRLAAPTLEITESELQLYGPFKHGINNHQIDSVLSQSVLRSETRSSVWAVEGSFDKLNMSKLNVPFVEFYTLEPPLAIDPASVQFRNGIDILITKSVRPGEAVVTHGNF